MRSKPYDQMTPREKYLHHHETYYPTGYKMSEVGTWLIYGEDANPNFGGSHNQPLIAVIKGRYTDVIDYAVALPSFWEWGAGGRIVKTNLVIIGD